MEQKVITMYTLEEARKIVQEQEKRKRKWKLYYRRQKFAGLVISLCGANALLMTTYRQTVSIALVAIGLYMILTRERLFIK